MGWQRLGACLVGHGGVQKLILLGKSCYTLLYSLPSLR